MIGAESTDPTVSAAGTTLIDQYNTYINNVVTSVNSAVASGYDLNGNATSAPADAFFYNSATGSASTGAYDLSLNDTYNFNSPSYDAAQIPAASSSDGQSDGGNATAISNSQTDPSILPYYQNLVSAVGDQVSASNTNLTAQQLVSTQVTNERQSVSGISTDDETTNLITYQRAFESASRFINVIDQMYQNVISMGTGS